MSDRDKELTKLLADVEVGNDAAVQFTCVRMGPWDVWGHAIDAYGGSLDAAKALHDAVLGNMNWQAGFVDAVPCAMVYPKLHDPDGKFYSESNTTPARALLISILKALIAKAEPFAIKTDSQLP